MSNIFEALQRSEAEHSGMDLLAVCAATELLQRAERQTALKWEAAAVPERPDATKSTERDTSFGLPERPPVPTAKNASVSTGFSPADEHTDILGQFQSLETSLSPKSRLVSVTDKESPAAESFRLLGVRLRHLRRDRPLKKLLITSTIPQEGKSMVAANLACALALGTEPRILLLEGDIRRPSLSEVFGLGRIPGLCEWLQGQRSLTTSIYHLENPGLWIFPAGSAPSNPLELLQSGKLSALMDQLATWFDWIIIDSPPVLPVADTSVWTRLADGILLVTRQGITERRQLQRGLEALEPQKILGALLNSCKDVAYSDYYNRSATVSHPSGSSAE